MTYLEFKQEVRKLLSDVTPDESLAASCVADYVKAKIVREVDKDLTLSSSYWSSFLSLKRRLAGFDVLTLPETFEQDVKDLLTVDANRRGIETFISRQIINGRTEIESLNTAAEKWMRQAVIDLQSHIPGYRIGQQSCYWSTDGSRFGQCLRARLPDGAALKDIYYVRAVPDLEEGVAYSANEYVLSNNRIYKVVVGGTLLPGELGDGLQTDTCSDPALCATCPSVIAPETLGSLSFNYAGEEIAARSKVQVISWTRRNEIASAPNKSCGTDPLININAPATVAIDPESYSAYFWPHPDGNHYFLVTWNGINFDFEDGDEIPLDEGAQAAVAEYVRAHLDRESDDRQRSREFLTAYIGLRARLFVDFKERKSVKFNR